MRKSCTYGSVRGASSNGGPYRDPVAKYTARSGAIHRNQIRAPSTTATMNPPINA